MTLNESIELHDTLNPKLFNEDETMKEEVRTKLQSIANEFLENIDIPLMVVDVELVGSNAAYNYTSTSDIDLHIIVNTELTYVKDDILQQLYNLKKNSFNKNYELEIYGLPVEVYIEDINASNATNGRYSITNDTWVKKPVYEKHEIPNISQELNDCMIRFEEVLASDDTQAIQDYINEIYMMRKLGLEAEGEYSIGNLVFKELRNNQVLDQLKNKYYQIVSDELSLKENKEIKTEKVLTSSNGKFKKGDIYVNGRGAIIRITDYTNYGTPQYDIGMSSDFAMGTYTCRGTDSDESLQAILDNNGYRKINESKERYDTIAFAQLLPMSYTDYIDSHVYDFINEWVDNGLGTVEEGIDELINSYTENLDKDELAEFNFDLAKKYIRYKLDNKLLTEGVDMLDIKEDNVYVAKNQYGYTRLGLIIDNDNKKYQLVTGQVLPTGKYKKTSGKDIDRRIEDLKKKGYTEFKGYGSIDR